jgi:hypothetical protein
MMRSSEAARLAPVGRGSARADDDGDGEEDRLVGDDDLDVDPLLPESELFIERLHNELEAELVGADAYERGFLLTSRCKFIWADGCSRRPK